MVPLGNNYVQLSLKNINLFGALGAKSSTMVKVVLWSTQLSSVLENLGHGVAAPGWVSKWGTCQCMYIFFV